MGFPNKSICIFLYINILVCMVYKLGIIQSSVIKRVLDIAL